jgi:hypothetical protein
VHGTKAAVPTVEGARRECALVIPLHTPDLANATRAVFMAVARSRQRRGERHRDRDCIHPLLAAPPLLLAPQLLRWLPTPASLFQLGQKRIKLRRHTVLPFRRVPCNRREHSWLSWGGPCFRAGLLLCVSQLPNLDRKALHIYLDPPQAGALLCQPPWLVRNLGGGGVQRSKKPITHAAQRFQLPSAAFQRIEFPVAHAIPLCAANAAVRRSQRHSATPNNQRNNNISAFPVSRNSVEHTPPYHDSTSDGETQDGAGVFIRP